MSLLERPGLGPSIGVPSPAAAATVLGEAREAVSAYLDRPCAARFEAVLERVSPLLQLSSADGDVDEGPIAQDGIAEAFNAFVWATPGSAQMQSAGHDLRRALLRALASCAAR
jgi:hypothetical protein